MAKRSQTDRHLVKHYAGGVGHIEGQDGAYRVSFYGRRVAQADVVTMADARKALSEFARVYSR
jgi:hypothetical protein